MSEPPEKPEAKLWQRLEATYSTKLPLLAKYVLSYYQVRGRNDARIATVSTQRMADDLSTSRKSIQRARWTLAMEGYIVPEGRWWKDEVSRRDRRVLEVYIPPECERAKFAEKAARWRAKNDVPYTSLSDSQSDNRARLRARPSSLSDSRPASRTHSPTTDKICRTLGPLCRTVSPPEGLKKV